MSVTVVGLLVLGGVGCMTVLVVLLALLRVAARSDAELERDVVRSASGPASPGTDSQALPVREWEPEIVERSGRFKRTSDVAPDVSERPLVG